MPRNPKLHERQGAWELLACSFGLWLLLAQVHHTVGLKSLGSLRMHDLGSLGDGTHTSKNPMSMRDVCSFTNRPPDFPASNFPGLLAPQLLELRGGAEEHQPSGPHPPITSAPRTLIPANSQSTLSCDLTPQGPSSPSTQNLKDLGSMVGREDEAVECYDEVELEDMEFDEIEEMFRYPCPCGDDFIISVEELLSGKAIAPCPSCTLLLKIKISDEAMEELRLIRGETG